MPSLIQTAKERKKGGKDRSDKQLENDGRDELRIGKGKEMKVEGDEL